VKAAQTAHPGLPGEPISLRELREACRKYDECTSYNESLERVRTRIGPDMDLGRLRTATGEDPFECLIDFLNQWGCRLPKKSPQLRKQTKDGLRAWWQQYARALPSRSERLIDAPLDSDRVLTLYRQLRKGPYGFGPASASKTLYVLRPKVFIPWDRKIRTALGHGEGPGDHYMQYLANARCDLIGADDRRERKRSCLDELESQLGCSAAELINKLYFMRYTYPSRKR